MFNGTIAGLQYRVREDDSEAAELESALHSPMRAEARSCECVMAGDQVGRRPASDVVALTPRMWNDRFSADPLRSAIEPLVYDAAR